MSSMLFFVITIGYAIRVIMSVAIDYIKIGTKFEKNETVQSLVLASFFAGYITAQILAGELSRRFGPKLVYIVMFAIAGVSTIVLPLAGPSLPMIMVCRVLTGFGEAILFPGTHAIVSYWIPSYERATVLTAIWSGTQVGTMLALATTELICQKLGWAWVFYIWGALAIVWVGFWAILAIDSPLSRSKGQGFSVFKISNREVEALVEDIPALSTPEEPTPWRKLISSSATWATVSGHFSSAWMAYVLLGYMPKFLKSLHFKVGSYGLIPYAGTAVISVIAGKLADVLIKKYQVDVKWVRRIMQTTGAVGASVFLALIAGIVKSEKEGALGVVFVTFAMSIGGFTSSGYGANHIDIGPKYAGPLMGITNTFATIPGIVGIFLTGFILDLTHGSYFFVWIIAIGIHVICTIFFWIFVKGHKIFE
jgi:ACS family sodium-dependent inorganic phosphate cotransporter-like MFS transporter 5